MQLGPSKMVILVCRRLTVLAKLWSVFQGSRTFYSPLTGAAIEQRSNVERITKNAAAFKFAI